MRKGAPVDRSLEKAPPLSCWVLLSSCPPGTILVEQLPTPHHQEPPPLHVPPNCPPCARATLTAWTPDLSIWGPDQKACSPMCSTAGTLLEWAAELHATTCSLLTRFTHNVKLLDWCRQAENWQTYQVSSPKL